MGKKTKLRLVFTLALGLGLFSLLLFGKRPVTSTSGWNATATLSDGSPVTCSIRKMWWQNGILFVEVEEPPECYHRWFALDMQTKQISRTTGPQDFPYPHWNYDQTYGSDLLDPMKSLTLWTIEWDGEAVTFWDDSIRITVTPASGENE